jgi:hypothetical protein
VIKLEKTSKTRRWVLGVIVGGMLLSVVVCSALLILGIFYPSLLLYAHWVSLTPSLFSMTLMVYTKEVIVHREYWKVMHPVVRFGWWCMIAFNMYLFVDNLFEVM